MLIDCPNKMTKSLAPYISCSDSFPVTAITSMISAGLAFMFSIQDEAFIISHPAILSRNSSGSCPYLHHTNFRYDYRKGIKVEDRKLIMTPHSHLCR